ncbi:MAG: glycosyltransferase [Hyphomicrobiales bacterium]|nr:glycosyltransferase [Hyphomicrobiales bacterium]MDE2115489.1 glycosyltransferase family 2 protein [Hyphomicrobiales bacterium]
MPRLSIALPVLNGGALIEATLQNLKDQTDGDFEVIVYDNASTDATNEIASRFAESDKRFKVVRRAQTVPLFTNFRETLTATDSEFMMWRAYDDLSALNYVAELRQLLDQSPRMVVAGSDIHSLFVDQNRQFIRPVPKLSSNRLLRTLTLMERVHPSWVYGMFRRVPFAPMVNQAIDEVPFWIVDHSMLFPALVNDQIGLTSKTHFIQRCGMDPDKPAHPTYSPDERWAIFTAFRQYCARKVDESDMDAVSKAIVKANLWRYVSKNSFRMRRMLKQRLLGK